MSNDIVRVFRIIQYIGTRDQVEKTVNNSIHGTKVVNPTLTITANTLGTYPEILEQAKDSNHDSN